MKKYSFLFITLSLLCMAQQEKFAGKKVVGYIANWADNSNVRYEGLSHAFFAFAKPTPNGGIEEFTSEQETALYEYLRQTKKHGCKRFISLGGGGDPVFPTMANDSVARNHFVQTVVQFCLEKKFDGIDMDWEAMQSESEKKNYTRIMKEFRIACNANKLQLVATIGFGNYWCQWIENEALQQADWIQLMIYDQTGTWNESPFGNHASFEHFVQAENYWVERGFTREKLVMGVPFYGYRFSSKNGGLGKYVSYAEIINQYSNLPAAADQTPGDDYCFFNGVGTMEKKTRYVLEKGLGGIMIWEMSMDVSGDKSLHQAILRALNP